MQRLVGEVIKSIKGLEKDSEEVFIYTESGLIFNFYREQFYCENVRLIDFELDNDLSGALVLSAEEVEGESVIDDEADIPATWAFYKIETIKGDLFMRWLGESNGYYSEAVNLAVYKI
jgi:hypothetical protein